MLKMCATIFILFFTGTAMASGNGPPLITSLTYTPVIQFATDINGGGSFSVNRHLFRLNFFKPISRKNQVGLGLHYDYEQWTFNTTGTTNQASPWKEVHRPTLTLNLMHTSSGEWRFMFAPSIGLSGTELSNTKDNLVYGAILSVSRKLTPDFTLGLGAGLFERLEKKQVFPFLLVNWQISDRLQLKNPFRAGPVGPAGLELEYNSENQWFFGVGGAYRSYRFRLSDNNSLPDGIGEVSFVAGFAKIAYHFNTKTSISFNAGGLFSGKLSTEDSSGTSIGKTGYDTAPFIALTLKGQF